MSESVAGGGSPSTAFPAGGGEMGERMHAHDWSRTPIGAPEGWSPSLRMMVNLLLVNRFPLLLWWGPQYIQIYNDPYRPVLGTKHPASLGQPAAECWPEIWNIIGPLIDTPFGGGPATWMEDIELEINRHGYVEESHFTIAYSPVPDDTAPRGIGGVLASVHEITDKLIGERRVEALSALASRVAEAKTAEEACATAAEILRGYPRDVPFAMLYLLTPGGEVALLAGTAGVAPGGPVTPSRLDFAADAQAHVLAPELRDAVRTETVQLIEALPERWPVVPPGPWGDAPDAAVAVPIKSNVAYQPAGVLVAGVSRRIRFDGQYRGFFELLAGQIATAVANARAYEAERLRAEALAELDRAKTAFFSNVSHEFRTPLTLLLAPVEQTLGSTVTPPEIRDRLELAHRNALRLQKLVNSLLDFARIEAGRVEAAYEPVDLAALTRDLASTFRSTIERAGLELEVDCRALRGPVYVDRDMWEKVVLNLLSNAFKFTLQGRITVLLREDAGQARLDVSDTGVGVAGHELPRLFERFYRVESVQGRTHEGSGIGLALVQELVRLHGGRVEVASERGHGSTFSVWLPLGATHLPAERIRGSRTRASTAIGAQAFVQEALRWLPDDRQDSADREPTRLALEDEMTPTDQRFAATFGARIVLADDNADMRAYLCELLAPYYTVVSTADGVAALEAVRSQRPDLVVSDVMMPRLDGFGLLAALRADESLRGMPVILLSARAGEEARIEGLDAGADDYLVKPFSARELLARVGAMLERSATTEQLAQERELLLGAERAARAEAESAIRAKDEFLATLSHELRTPLSNIVSWAGILQRKYAAGDDQLKKGLRVIVDNAMAQSQIIADLVDMSRIVAGKIALELKPVDLAELAALTVNAQRPAAGLKNVLLTLELEQDGAAVVLADPTRVQQVMWNLISNALKFTPPGGQVRVRMRANGGREIELEVRDTGEGIAPEMLPYVFDRFRQADSSASRRHGGLGLGLAIVKQLVELHGGEVCVSSAGPGQGATFTVHLPAYRADVRSPLALGQPSSVTETPEGQQLAGLRVLAVEDQRDMLEFLQRLLEEQGAEVLTAASGPAALEMLQKTATLPVDVLVCDIGMPRMDGYQLLHAVRTQLRLAPDVLPAVAVTAYAREQDRERTLAAGFQAHVAKPYQVAQLVAILCRLRQAEPVD